MKEKLWVLINKNMEYGVGDRYEKGELAQLLVQQIESFDPGFKYTMDVNGSGSSSETIIAANDLSPLGQDSSLLLTSVLVNRCGQADYINMSEAQILPSGVCQVRGAKKISLYSMVPWAVTDWGRWEERVPWSLGLFMERAARVHVGVRSGTLRGPLNLHTVSNYISDQVSPEEGRNSYEALLDLEGFESRLLSVESEDVKEEQERLLSIVRELCE